MDLYLDQDAFIQAEKILEEKSAELEMLLSSIAASFEQLRSDWDSDAGKKFFERFESDLIKNLKDHAKVFAHMSKNLSIASQKYEEVFRAADTVADAQY